MATTKKGFGEGQIAPATKWLVTVAMDELSTPTEVAIMDELPAGAQGILLCSEGNPVSAEAAQHLTTKGQAKDVPHVSLLINRGGEIPFFGERTILVNIIDRSEQSDEVSSS